MRWIKYIAVLVLVAAIVGFGFYMFQLAPASSNPDQTADVTITTGMSRADVAHVLFKNGIIKNELAFTAYSKVTGSAILPGPYALSAADSVPVISQKLATGDFQTVNITIIEGWRVTDMEKYLVQTKGLKQLTGFAAIASPYEGYLFPDTYNVRVDITTDQLIKEMRDNFTTRTQGLKVDSEVVILASIVEREANTEADRTAIAAVYLNRLKAGMPMDADPTIQYAKGNWEAVTLADYKDVISPYNTYLHIGLPPGPISNPGLKSINAVLNPDKSTYLYFFTAHNVTYYSNTLQEQEAKIALYF